MEFRKEDGLDPNRLYDTRTLAFIWGYDGPRNLETALKKLGVKLLAVGKGITLVRLQDVWNAFDEAA